MSITFITSGSWATESGIAIRRISASKAAFPFVIFSSRRSFLNHWRILFLASELFTRLSQSRLGPFAEVDVMTSTISPDWSWCEKGTMRPLTLAIDIWLPTAEWME